MRIAKLIPVIWLLCLVCLGQEAKLKPLHPGDVLKVQITFTGPDADKIKTVALYLGSTSTVPENQPGFTTGFPGGSFVSAIAPRTFEPEITIDAHAISGEYRLYVNYKADPFQGQYSSQKDFAFPEVRVENNATFIPPKIEVKPRP